MKNIDILVIILLISFVICVHARELDEVSYVGICELTRYELLEQITIENGYAYVRSGSTVYFVDISNPGGMRYLGQYGIPGNVTALDVRGKFIIASCRTGGREPVGFNGLIVIDITDPQNAYAAGRVKSNIIGKAMSIYDDKLLLCADVLNHNDSLLVFDISSPTSPSFVGGIAVPPEFTTEINFSNAKQILISGDKAFITFRGLDCYCVILDLSSIPLPTFVTYFDLPVFHSVAVDGNLLLCTTGEGLSVFDIEDPSEINEIGWMGFPGGATSITKLHDNAVLVAERSLKVVDVSVPSSPTLIQQIAKSYCYRFDCGAASSECRSGDKTNSMIPRGLVEYDGYIFTLNDQGGHLVALR